MTPLTRQLRWYIAIRVVAIVSVLLPLRPVPALAAAAVPQAEPGFTGPPVPSHSAVAVPEPELLPGNILWLLGGATFVATLVYIALLRLLRRSPRPRPTSSSSAT